MGGEVDPLEGAEVGVLEKAALVVADDVGTVDGGGDRERNARRDEMDALRADYPVLRVDFDVLGDLRLASEEVGDHIAIECRVQPRAPFLKRLREGGVQNLASRRQGFPVT